MGVEIVAVCNINKFHRSINYQWAKHFVPIVSYCKDSKAGLAARALDGSDEEIGASSDIQLEAMVSLLTAALEEEERQRAKRARALRTEAVYAG